MRSCGDFDEICREGTDIHRIERFAIVSFGKFQGTFCLAKLNESYRPVRGRIPVV
jgi:hypothetical protein